MPDFFYSAVDTISGKGQNGFLKADSYAHAYDKLTALGLVPKKVFEIPKWLPVWFFRAKPYMKTPEIIDFLESIGHAFNAGVQLTEILIDLQFEMKSKRAKIAIQYMIEKLREGESFSSIVKSLAFFPPIVSAFVEIGEATGALGDNCLKASARLKFTEDLKSQVKRALIYPIFVFVTMLAAICVWLFVVIPKVAQLFQSLDISLPWYTVALINLSFHKVRIAYFLFGLFLLVFLVFLINYFIKKIFGKGHLVLRMKDKFLLRLPVLGNLLTYYNTFLISSFLSALIAAGVSLTHALVIIGNAINNAIYFYIIDSVRLNIEQGETVSESFRVFSLFFPSMFMRYLVVGERTGTLETQLEYLGNVYKSRVENTLSLIPKLLEPIMIVFIGGLMLGMIIAIFMPIYGSLGKIINSIQ